MSGDHKTDDKQPASHGKGDYQLSAHFVSAPEGSGFPIPAAIEAPNSAVANSSPPTTQSEVGTTDKSLGSQLANVAKRVEDAETVADSLEQNQQFFEDMHSLSEQFTAHMTKGQVLENQHMVTVQESAPYPMHSVEVATEGQAVVAAMIAAIGVSKALATQTDRRTILPPEIGTVAEAEADEEPEP